MTLTSYTKKFFIVTFLVAVFAIAAVVYLFIQIKDQGEVLQSHISIITEEARRENSYARLERTVTETEKQRAALSEAFFKEQSDSLSFLTYIEELAPRAGISLTTVSIDSVSNAGATPKTEIKMQFSYGGNKQAVIDFTRLLEVLPYHSRLDTLTLTDAGGGVWKGEVTLFVTVRSL